MEIWPAIDLRGGKCVRLRQGDYCQETVFSDDPAAMATHWVGLEDVMLTLGRSGRRPRGPAGRTWPSVRSIVEAVDVPCELGGGIRNEESIRDAVGPGPAAAGDRHAGPARARLVPRRCAGSIPDRLVLGIDARGGRVATEGWLATSDVAAAELARPVCRRADWPRWCIPTSPPTE